MKIINGLETFTRNEAAELTNVPLSTLLFWEKRGLLKIYRDTENGYRYYIHQDLQDIIRMNFYRNVNIPIINLKSFPLKLDEMQDLLINQTYILDKEIKKIEEMKERINKELNRYQYIIKYKDISYEKTVFPFKRLIRKTLGKGQNIFKDLYSSYLEPMYQVYIPDKKFAYLCVDDTKKEVSINNILYEENLEYECIELLFLDKHETSKDLVERLQETNDITYHNLMNRLEDVVHDGYKIKTIILQQIFPINDTDGLYKDCYKVFLQVKKIN